MKDIDSLAKTLGVASNDVMCFMKCIAGLMANGHTFESALARHARMTTAATGNASRLINAVKNEQIFDLHAALATTAEGQS